MPFSEDPKSGIEIYTHKIYTYAKISNLFFIGSLAIHLTCLSIEAFIAGSREVVRKNEARREKEAATVSRKKTKLGELILSAKVIKDKMKSKTYKLNCKDLLVLVRYKNAESSGMTKVKTRVIIKNI